MTRSAHLLRELRDLAPAEIDLTLARIRTLLDALGNPERDLPPVIHVAGTNGKGSVIAFMRAMLEAAGRRVHSYTSPALLRPHECIRLAAPRGGRSAVIGEEAFAECLERVLACARAHPVTPFESLTAAAFLAFAEHPADILLLETGLGGRLDATNAIPAARLCVLTPIAIDHSEWLGTTLAEIAGEKAGILRPETACILAAQADEALDRIANVAARRRTPLLCQGRDWDAYEQQGRLVYQDHTSLLDLPLPALFGRHQIANAGLAIATLRQLEDRAPDEAAIAQGLLAVRWPGRLELLRAERAALAPSPAARQEIWLDGAHNGAGSVALAQALADLEERSALPLHLIVGMQETKDPSAFLEPFAGLAEVVIATPIRPRVPNGGRAMAPEIIVGAAEALGLEAQEASSLKEALARSRRRSRARTRVLITGSLHLVAEAHGLFGNQLT